MEPIFYSKIDIQIRFNDLDAYRHVNNNSYFSYYDLGKDEYFREVFPPDFRLQTVVPIIANIKADFLQPIFYGDKIVMETRCSRLGTRVSPSSSVPSTCPHARWCARAKR